MCLRGLNSSDHAPVPQAHLVASAQVIVDNGSEAEHHAGDVTLRGSHALGNLFDDFIAVHLVVVDGLGLILAVRRERRLVFLNDFVFHIL